MATIRKSKSPAGRIHKVPLAAVSVTAQQLAMIDSAGYGRNAAASVSNNGCVGVWLETVDNSAGSAGDLYGYAQEGCYLFDATTVSQTSLGDTMYAENGTTVDETQGANEPVAGKLEERISDSEVYVDVGLAFRWVS